MVVRLRIRPPGPEGLRLALPVKRMLGVPGGSSIGRRVLVPWAYPSAMPCWRPQALQVNMADAQPVVRAVNDARQLRGLLPMEPEPGRPASAHWQQPTPPPPLQLATSGAALNGTGVHEPSVGYPQPVDKASAEAKQPGDCSRARCGLFPWMLAVAQPAKGDSPAVLCGCALPSCTGSIAPCCCRCLASCGCSASSCSPRCAV